MTSFYDQLAAQDKSTPPSAPANGPSFYDQLAAQDKEQARLRTSLDAAMQTTPEKAARVKYLSTVTGLAPSVIETEEGEAEARAKFQQIQKEAQFSPVLQRKLQEPEFTKLAIDDVPTLAKIEQGIGSVMQFVMGADGKGGLPGMVQRGAQKGYWGSVQGTAGAFSAATEFVAPIGDLLEGQTSIGGNPLRRLAEGFGLISKNADAKGDAIKSPYDGNIAAGAESGFSSLTQNAKYMPLVLAGPPGAAAALLGMALESGGKSYDEARQKGINQNTALIYGASDAAIEFATEKIPMHRLIGDVAANTGFFKTLIKQIGLEVPGEQIATALQDLNEWAVMNPEKTFGDYIAARPDAAVQTLVATIVGTGGNVAVTKALGTLMDAQVQKDYNDRFNAERQAQDRMAKLQDVMATAAGSKLRELSPETFAAHVQAAADGQEGAPKSVHIDGQVLLQSLQSAGVTEEQLAQTLPSIAAQLAEAAAANSTVEIPIGELATALPGTPLEQALLPHLRIGGPESLSQFEAEQAQQQAQDFLKTESERVMQQSQDQTQWTQESEGIKTTIRDQLDGTGRFSKDVTSKYATLVRDFYSVMASRAGMTPDQLYKLMPYKVAGQGQGALDQTESGKAIEKAKALRGMIDGQQLSQIQAELANYVKATAQDNISPQEIETATGLLTPMMERATAAKPGFDATVNEISRSFGNDAMLADVKGMDRAAVKLMRETGTAETGPDISEIRDLLRATVVVNRVEDIQAAIDAIGQKFEVLRIKNRFDKPLESGYRDVLMNVGLADGTVAEIQINVPAMLLAKNTGHKLYEMSRDLPEGDARRVKLEAMQTQLYAKAFAFALNAANLSSSAANSSGVTLSPLANTTAEGNGRDGSFANTADPSASLNTGTPSTSYNAAPGGTTNSGDISNTSDTILPANGVLNQSVSTRVPTAKKALENPLSSVLTIGLEASKSEPKAFEKNVSVVTGYTNYRDAPSANTTEKKAERFINHVRDNLLWLHDQIDEATRNRSKLWYDGARNIVDRWVPKFGYTDAQTSGVLAVLSPQKDWFMNVSLAERILDAMKNRQDTAWSPEMSATAAEIWSKPQYKEQLAEITGKKLSELADPVLKAMWIRTYDQSHNSRNYRLVTPEGGFGEHVTNADGVTRSKAGWGSLGEIAKAVSIIEDGSIENISNRLGGQHKVRNFYNNIFDPNDKHGSVTIDTHAVAAGLIRPLSGSSPEVEHNFGGGGSASSAMSGAQGTYGLYAEAYRRAAKERGILPREMQSITWEAVRGLFTPGFKAQAKNVDAIGKVWENYKLKRISLDEARKQITELAGNINPPDWVGHSAGTHEGAGDSSYSEELAGAQLPRRNTGADASGTGTGDSTGTGEVNGRQYQQAGNGSGRTESRRLAPLEGAPSVAGFHGPDPRVVAVAESYAAANGIDLKRQAAYATVDPERGARIAQAYAEMAHNPQDPAVKEAYDNLIKQTVAQYQALVDAGYKFHFIDLNSQAGQEYASTPWNAMRDMRQNQRMGVFSTEAGFGSDADFSPEANPLLADTGFEWPMGDGGQMQRVLANDLFRAVHDAFGHGMEGAGFRAQGEENAWQAHVRLFTGSAVGAITSETRGQNSWLNFGPNGESNQTAKVEDTVFADQKTGLMPEWTWTEGRVGDAVTAPSNKYQTIFLAGRDPAQLSPEDRAQYDQLATPLLEQSDTVLERAGVQNARGTFDPSSLTTVLNEGADLSTFLHETGHFFLEAMAHLASQPQSSDSVRADMTALLKWFGVKDLETWNQMTLDQKRKHHERFAESFELYLLEGKAPNTELASLFRTFRAWLTRVYRSLSDFMAGRDLQLSDDIRQVMDRMLATEQQIAEAEKVAGLLPELDATGEAIEKLQARSIRDLKWAVNARNKFIKELQQEAREKRKEVQTEVTAEVNAMPEFAAKQALDDLRKATKDNPTDADLAAIADAYGFKDYDSMLSSIEAVGKKSDVIEGLTDQRMLERYGDLIDKQSIEQAATEAVHNAARAKSLATELAAQRELLNPRQDTGRTNTRGAKITVNALMEAAKQFAANVIGRKAISDLKKAAYTHLQAERRAAKAWEAATAKGDTKAAVQAKQDQVLNNAAVRAAHEAQAEVRKTLEFFAKVLKGNDETVVAKGRDPDVVNAARAILAVYGVGAFKGKNAFEYMDLLKTNDPSLFAILDDSVRAAVGNAKPLDKLTVSELEALKDEIASMWHLAKSSRQYEVDGNRMDIEEAAEQLTERMEEKGVPAVMPGDFSAVTEAQKRGRSLQFAGALLRRVESWAEGMDGKFGGPFLRLVFQPVKAAADRYRADRTAYRKKFTKLVENVAPQLKPGLIEAPELGYTFGKGKGGVGQAELVSAMLHLGNSSNKRKLLLGRNWATENADGTLDTSKWDAFMERMHNTGVINKAHYDFAQGVWDLMEEMKPAAQKTHRDVYGRYFAEVTSESFEVPGIGFYRGGYVPAQVDPEIVKDNEMRKLAEQENESMSYAFPSTNKGFTKGRVEYNRPLMLDLRTLPQHMDKVLLFTHMEPAVRGVSKVLQAKNVGTMLGKVDPSAISGMLSPWLNRSARQIVETPIVGDGRISRVLSVIRARAGMSVMFANLSNTAQQIAGLTLAGVKVKPKYLMSAMAQYTVHPKKTSESVAAASTFMANRMDDQVAALNGTMEDILLNPSVYESAQNWTAKHAYFLQSAFDNVIGPIVWSAAYNQALEQKMSESEAVKFADGTIRQTQGSTLPEDVSRIETGPSYARIFTQFIGYFNMVANTNVTALQNIADDVGLAKGAGKALAVVFMGLLAPAWIAEAIAQGFKGGPDDEDKDGEYLDDWLKAVFGMGTMKTLLAGVPFVGQFAMAGANTWNDKPYDDRTSLSPAVSLLEGSVRAPVSVYKALVDDGSKQKAIRDTATAISLMTGLPVSAAARPLGYLAGVADDKIDPTSGVDAARGLVTGVASPASK